MGEAKRRKAILGDQYGQMRTPYYRATPMSPIVQSVWRSTCEQGFAMGGRGTLIRTKADGLGKAGYLPLSAIDDPVGRQIVESYDPETQFVVAEPNENGGTRWQLFEKED